MQDLAFRQNRLFDNIRKYYIASKYERKNLLKEEYGYKEEDIIDTGIPRFDGLQDKSENMILLIPTWRVNVASNISNDRIRTRNSSFKETEYFKIYNSLINNKDLLKLLKKNDYKVVFLIHPTLISNKDDYDKNDYVDIISAADVNYEDVLTRAKVMITDYSGVQYDFAYMHKPIVYYHNPLLPPSYDDGMMNYKTMGFGDIVENEDDLIKIIDKYLNSGVRIEKKYEDRINSFFLFDDYDNCKRIFEVNVNK
jgi:CDP-glycerol glycerophosphotransferase (TagB/SpsB family)